MDDTLNKLAKDRFEAIKANMKLRAQKEVVERTTKIFVDKEKIQTLLDDTIDRSHSVQNLLEETKEALDTAAMEVDRVMGFIDSLKLPPELSIAVAYIIAAKDNKVAELHGAVVCLEKQIEEWS